MQKHEFSFVIDATAEELWRAMHPPRPKPAPGEIQIIEHGGVRIEILHPGDEHGDGLVRHCYFPVPKYLLSRGVGQSWEWVTETRPNESSRYDAVGKPLWSKAHGRHRFEDLGDGRTRVHFSETYHVFNPVMRLLLERRVHRFISKDNDRLVKAGVEGALAAARSRARANGEEHTPAR